ncbi:glycosyltransferase [Bradyrhizobium sediminis]|uniref:Glycosyltransferase n=1 Tax=Bradyrhizobium sediminis TaxID=2840469 RepID=A0A975NLL7_9BRAD|nr:glycosyltransferase family 2 protein [Bradyrhizobium sediminis]QWG17090.1 glycosyltransferase [Bradyrhizobium sediminis]
MDDEFKRELLERLKAIEERLDGLDTSQSQLQEAYARSRAHLRRFWLRPPMWTFEQHSPRPLDLRSLPAPPSLPKHVPTIAVVTPSFNHGQFLAATIDSVIGQNYPALSYHVQDGGSEDDTVAILKGYADKISWRSEPDKGQSDAINQGFAGVDGDIMAYLNSDDILLPGALTYVAKFFAERPDIDVVYGHRIFIDYAGSEIGRAILPAHSIEALRYAGYVPQETMFWRRRVWDAVGPMDRNFHYALDWDFMLRAQAAGFKFARARRFLACFRVHDAQKTTKNYELGRKEMQRLRLRNLGYVPSQLEISRAIAPYLLRQFICHWSYRLGLLRH